MGKSLENWWSGDKIQRRTLWRWNVMSPTSITTSLGSPVVQNLTTNTTTLEIVVTRNSESPA